MNTSIYVEICRLIISKFIYKQVSDEIKFQVTSYGHILISIQLVYNNTKPDDNMYSSKVHRSIFNSTFFNGTL